MSPDSDTGSTLGVILGGVAAGFAALAWITWGPFLLIAMPLAIAGVVAGCCSKSRLKAFAITVSAVALVASGISWFVVKALARELSQN